MYPTTMMNNNNNTSTSNYDTLKNASISPVAVVAAVAAPARVIIGVAKSNVVGNHVHHQDQVKTMEYSIDPFSSTVSAGIVDAFSSSPSSSSPSKLKNRRRDSYTHVPMYIATSDPNHARRASTGDIGSLKSQLSWATPPAVPTRPSADQARSLFSTAAPSSSSTLAPPAAPFWEPVSPGFDRDGEGHARGNSDFDSLDLSGGAGADQFEWTDERPTTAATAGGEPAGRVPIAKKNDYYDGAIPDVAFAKADGAATGDLMSTQHELAKKFAAANIAANNASSIDPCANVSLVDIEHNIPTMSSLEWRTLMFACAHTSLSSHSSLSTSARRTMLQSPLPRSAGVIHCIIRRTKSGFMSLGGARYEIFLEEPNRPLFMISVAKTKLGGSDYELSMRTLAEIDAGAPAVMHSADDQVCLGRIKSNFSGSEYSGISDGNKLDHTSSNIVAATAGRHSRTGSASNTPTKKDNNQYSAASGSNLYANGSNIYAATNGSDLYAVASSINKIVRQELCAIVYESNIMSTCPRKFVCVIPSLHSSSSSSIEPRSLLSQYAQHNIDRAKYDMARVEPSTPADIIVLTNRVPVFDKSIQAYCLNFKGRATVASVKNFQLVRHNSFLDSSAPVVLQFGKIGRDDFTMDVMYPLSMVQAVQICIAGLDTKLVCD